MHLNLFAAAFEQWTKRIQLERAVGALVADKHKVVSTEPGSQCIANLAKKLVPIEEGSPVWKGIRGFLKSFRQSADRKENMEAVQLSESRVKYGKSYSLRSLIGVEGVSSPCIIFLMMVSTTTSYLAS